MSSLRSLRDAALTAQLTNNPERFHQSTLSMVENIEHSIQKVNSQLTTILDRLEKLETRMDVMERSAQEQGAPWAPYLQKV